MLSRVAQVLYWMFRYLERAQNTARFIDSDLNQLLDDPKNQGSLWHSLIAATGDSKRFDELYPDYSRDNIVRFLTLDEDYNNSILSSLGAARENARTIRESISSEMWEEVNTLYLYVKGLSKKSQVDAKALCKIVLDGSYQFIGLFYSTMNRNHPWHFARLPDAKLVGSVYDNTQWAALLKSVSGLEMYRKSYRRISPRDVSEFLLLNRHFPRSIGHCVHYFVDSLRHLTEGIPGETFAPLGQTVFDLKSELDRAQIDDILSLGLHEYLDRLQSRLNTIDDEIFRTFFSPAYHEEGEGGNTGQSQS